MSSNAKSPPNAGTMLINTLRTFIYSMAVYFGGFGSQSLVESARENNALLSYIIGLVILNLVYWYSLKQIPFDAVTDWIIEMYNPFNQYILLIIVRLTDHIFFDGSGSSVINKLDQPVVLIAFLAVFIVIIQRRLNKMNSDMKSA
jgi:hypothetical protein